MCQTIPGKVTQVRGTQAEVEVEGHTGWFDASAEPNVQPDDYVLTHADLIVSIISEAEALRLEQEIRDARRARDASAGGGGGGAADAP